MPKLPGESQEHFMEKRMHDFKHGEMHSGTGVPGQKQKAPVKNRKQAIAIALSESRKHPGLGGPDPLDHHGPAITSEAIGKRAASDVGIGRGVVDPGHKIGRSVAAPDVALPHRVQGSHQDNWLRHQPEIAHGMDRAPRKEGAYPAPLAAADSSGYRHDATQRQGHLRNSGDSRAHRIGRK